MRRVFQNLNGCDFDLLVIGGGIFGACAAWDAALRGMNVALIERGDFGAGTSANSFKMIHGGIRYLQHGDIARLRASCRERTAMLRVAPHLVTTLPIVVPTYGGGREGRVFLGAGMRLYDLLTANRNRGVARERHIPATRFIDAAEVERLFPGIGARRASGAAVFCDGQVYNPPRLVLAFVRSAVERGAFAVNYAEALTLRRQDDTVVGARVRDVVTGNCVAVRARAVLNAAGPWVPWMMRERERAPLARTGTYSRDVCLVVPRRFEHPYGLAVQGTTHDPDALVGRAARHLFVVPWRQHTLCGVWHRVATERPEDVCVTAEELEDYAAQLNAAVPSLQVDPAEITMCNSGLLPSGDNQPDACDLRYGKRSLIVDHAKEPRPLHNLVSLIGVRYTMARGDAAKAVDLVCRKLGRAAARPRTDRLPVVGGGFESFEGLIAAIEHAARGRVRVPAGAARALAHNYGSRWPEVVRLASGPDRDGCIAGSTTLRAEVVHAVREEMAVHLADIVYRRTDLGSGGHPGRQALEEAASLAAQELGWSAAKRGAELADVERLARGAASASPPPVSETA